MVMGLDAYDQIGQVFQGAKWDVKVKSPMSQGEETCFRDTEKNTD